MKSRFRLLILGATLSGVTPGMTREPTQLEQYYLELVNRARANPNGEVTRLSAEVWGDEGSPAVADLNEGLAPGTLSGTARQPLAFDTRLIDAASDYSDFLLATEQFSHTAKGSASSRMTSAGYTFTPPSIAGENLAITASSGPHPVDKTRVDKHHEGLFIDGDVAGRGHRINLLLAEFREAGIAIRADSDGDSFFTGPLNDVLSTQNFAKSAGRIFVTGVIHYDTNTNSFYDPGESAGILALTVKTMGGATVASGTSFGSGGYSINLNGVAAGTYQLVVRDALNSEDSVSFSWTGTENVKVDLRNPNLTAPPVLGIPFRPDARIGLAPASLTGNDFYSDSPLAQNLRRIARKRSSLVWHARIENDGNQQDSIRVTGTRSSSLFRVLYFRQDGSASVNSTAQLMAGLTRGFQIGEEANHRIVVSPRRNASGRRKGFQFHLRGVSTNHPGKIDRVNGQVVNRIR